RRRTGRRSRSWRLFSPAPRRGGAATVRGPAAGVNEAGGKKNRGPAAASRDGNLCLGGGCRSLAGVGPRRLTETTGGTTRKDVVRALAVATRSARSNHRSAAGGRQGRTAPPAPTGQATCPAATHSM